MICLKVDIPDELCETKDELKAIYHSSDSVCIWVFESMENRKKFMQETIGMSKKERENHYNLFYSST
tara:strand:- start:337 stop:537 length:201 start_codon:yes stop_codon:yes gene_type:complete